MIEIETQTHSDHSCPFRQVSEAPGRSQFDLHCDRNPAMPVRLSHTVQTDTASVAHALLEIASSMADPASLEPGQPALFSDMACSFSFKLEDQMQT